MCRYLAKDVHILCHLSVHTSHITNLPYQYIFSAGLSISSITDEVYLFRASKYIFSEKRVFECAAFGLDNRRVNGMFYEYLVLYSDYRADIWFYLAHLHTQKIGILVIFLVNFR